MGSMQQTLTTLIRPGWESAEVSEGVHASLPECRKVLQVILAVLCSCDQMVIPILHKSLAALLAVLIYVAQWSPPALRIHLYIMCGLTLCLWGCITM